MEATTTNSKTSSSPIDEQNYTKCQEQSKFYHGKFPEIPSLSSTDLISKQLQLQQRRQSSEDLNDKVVEGETKPLLLNNRLIVVDVRTKAERNVSMIPGAISLAQFHTLMEENPGSPLKSSTATAEASEDRKDDGMTVVTYCTIGYRSGLEARQIKERYSSSSPGLTIYNLDGIVSYTHACSTTTGDMDGSLNHGDAHKSSSSLSLIHPKTKEVTNRVHIFGKDWNFVHSSYEPQVYPCWSLVWNMAKVGFVGFGRAVRNCLPCKWQRSNGDGGRLKHS